VATLVDWCKAVDDAPGDATVRLLWADALEEDGKVLEAECLRWAATSGGPILRPGLCPWPSLTGMPGDRLSGWYGYRHGSAHSVSGLPDELWGLLVRRPGDDCVGKYYPTASAAWLALMDAYRRWKECKTP
jgi:uncharacterized protein (TIGR02996 family)